MKKINLILGICVWGFWGLNLMDTAWADSPDYQNHQNTQTNTYGYLGFWHDPNDPQSVPQTKTTQENLTQTEAQTEFQQFCTEQNQAHLSGSLSGCFGQTLVHNECVAAAWAGKRGLLRPDNLIIVKHPDFHQVGKLALKACRREFGWLAKCEVETVYCSDSTQYDQP